MGTALVDVHAHYLPPAYREAALAAGHSQPDGVSALPEWDAGGHVELMDRLGHRRQHAVDLVAGRALR